MPYTPKIGYVDLTDGQKLDLLETLLLTVLDGVQDHELPAHFGHNTALLVCAVRREMPPETRLRWTRPESLENTLVARLEREELDAIASGEGEATFR